MRFIKRLYKWYYNRIGYMRFKSTFNNTCVQCKAYKKGHKWVRFMGWSCFWCFMKNNYDETEEVLKKR